MGADRCACPHRDRIERYLHEHFALELPEVVPVHALGAWQSTIEPDAAAAARLRSASRLDALESRLEKFVMDQAISARLRSPRDCLHSYHRSVKEQLRPYAGMFRSMYDSAEKQQNDILTCAKALLNSERRRTIEISAAFEVAIAAIGEFVDQQVAAGESVALNAAWSTFLNRHGIDQIEACMRKTVVARLRAEITAQVEESCFDASRGFSHARVAELFSEVSAHTRRSQYRRVGGKVTAAIAGYAVINLWNPSGWAAVAAAVVSAGVGIAADRAIASREESDRQVLSGHRERIVAALEARLRRHCRQATTSYEGWLATLPATLTRDLSARFGFLSQGSRVIWQATVRTLHELDDAAAALDEQWLRQCVELASRELHGPLIRHTAYADGVGVKLLAADVPADGGAWKARLAKLTGAEVALVDAAWPLAERVVAALHPAQLSTRNVRVERHDTTARRSAGRLYASGNRPVVCVTTDAEQAKRAIGPGGANVRSVERLLGLKRLVIQGPRDEERRK